MAVSGQGLRVALLGCGVVGSEVVRQLVAQPTSPPRVGAPLELAGIAVRRPQRARRLPVDQGFSPLTRGARHPRRRRHRRRGRRRHRAGPHLAPVGDGRRQERRHRQQGAARRRRRDPVRRGRARPGVDLYFEASVAGAIPLLRPLRESLVGDRSCACSASSTARPTTSSPHGRDRGELRRGARGGARRSGTPKPTRPPTWTGSTRPPRPRSSRRSRSTPGCTSADVYREGIARRHAVRRGRAPGRWAARSSCSPSPSARPTRAASACGCTRR